MIGKFSVKKPYTVLVAVVMVIVLGVVSFTRMTTDLLPDINLPYVVVMTTYGGASPETVETVVTKPVESSMATVSNIEGISSISSENYSMVILEFAQSTNMDTVSLEIREKLDQIKGYWPDAVGNPIMMKLNPNMLPVMVAAVGMEGMDNARISEMTKAEIVPELESLEGVASVSTTGLVEDSVHVIIRQDKIDAINEQVFGVIDEEMADAEKELADGKAQLAEKQGDLAEARQKIADGRAELEDGKAELEKGKAELDEKKNSATAQIAQGSAALVDGNAQLAANKALLQSEIAVLEQVLDSLDRAELEQGIRQIDAIIAQIEQLRQMLPDREDGAGEEPGTQDEVPAGEEDAADQPDGGNETDRPEEEQTNRPDDGTNEQQPGPEEESAKPDEENEAPAPEGDTERPEGTGEAAQPGEEGDTAQPGGADERQEEPDAPAQDGAGTEEQTEEDGAREDVKALANQQEESGSLKGQKITRATYRMETLLSQGRERRISYFADDSLYLAAAPDEDVMEAILQNPELVQLITEVLGNTEWMHNTLDALLAALQSAKTGLQEGINKLDEAEAGIAQMKEALAILTEKEGQLKAGLTELEKAKLTAAIEFANGKSQLSIAQMQITAGEAQLDSSESQLEAGEEQIKSAKEQLEDGEEQLKEAKEQAYAKADMNGVLTVDTVKSLLVAQNFSMPGGYVTEEGIDYLVRVGEKPDDLEALKKLPLLNLSMDGVDVITLEDVADVFMTDNADEVYTNVNGNPGILLSIQKQTGYSTGDVSDKLKAKFDQMMAEKEGLDLITLMDQGIYIDLVMDSILSNVMWGALLAILILILFLRDLRPTLVIACSIPISLVTAIVCMYFSGVTLNVISLSGLALGIGMLVDNSIVVIENIYRMRSEGYSMKEAAVEGAGEVAGAIMASTLTTVCVFAPIVFTEGITRQLFVDMGLTIAYSLLASLIVALTVVPAMASKVLRKTRETSESRFFEKLKKGYAGALSWSLRHKPVVLLSVVVLLVVSVVASLSKGTAFMSDMDSTQITVNVTLPKGATLEETGEATDTVVERIRTLSEVEDVGAMTSGGSMSMLMGSGGSSNAAIVYVTLCEDKDKTNEEIAAEIYAMNQDLTERDVEIEVDTSSMDMSAMTGEGISIHVRGRETDTLQEIAREVAALVAETEGTSEVSDGVEETTEELRVLVDRQKAIDHGLTVAQVFQQIAAKLADPASATELSTQIKEYDVYVIDGRDLSLTRQDIRGMDIRYTNEDGLEETVPLSEIASFEEKEGLKSISREEQSRYVTVTAGIREGYNVGLVSAEVEKKLKDYELPYGYALVMDGENEMIMDAMEQVILMLLLALVFMYLIMVAQFQSLLSPFIIMFTIPLAFTGGFLGLYLSNSEVSVIALIGFVMLSGIIVNNGIVLVDYINQLRAGGMEKKQAIMEAGSTRLRPVLMTALTTILALSTMVFSKDMGSEMAKPMAVVTIGGLTYGTVLTLVVIPCIYDLVLGRKKKGAAHEKAESDE